MSRITSPPTVRVGWNRRPLGLLILGAILAPLALLAWAALRLLGLAGMAGVAGIRYSLTHDHRAAFAPAWLLLAALASTWLPAREWAWAALAVASFAASYLPESATIRGRRWLSTRERLLFARTAAGIALVQCADPAQLGPGWFAGLLTAVVLAGAVGWWSGRRVRPAEPEPEHIRLWGEIVVPAYPELAGTWVERDDVARTAVLRLDHGKAEDVADLDADIEATLRQRPGTVVLAADPGLTRDLVRIAWPSVADASEYRFWDGPSLQPSGLYVAGYAHGSGEPVFGRLWRPRGACHTAVVGGTGSGKGVFVRVWAMELGLYEHGRLYVADGAGGRGVPEVEGFATEYATTPAQWLTVVDRVYRIMLAREQRYGAARKSGFRPGPLEPLIGLAIDEGDTVNSSSPQIRTMLKYLTARGRGVGVHVLIDGQYGAQGMYGYVDTRNNILAGGTLWIGHQGDSQGKQAARQEYKIDLGKLPEGPGWAFLASKVVDGQAVVPARGPFIASRQEVEEALDAGDKPPPTPFGVAEDWHHAVVHGKLHEVDEAAAELAGPPCGQELTESGNEDAELTDAQDESGTGDSPRLQLVTATWATPPEQVAAKETGADRVRAVLADADGPLTVAEIADAADLTQRHTRDLLKALARANAAAEGDPKTVDGKPVTTWRNAS